MSFSNEIDKPASERFMLVRLEPSRHVSDDLALDSGYYQMSFADPIFKVTRNGTELTKVSSNPSSNDEWYYDGSTLKVQLASAPDSSTNVIVVSYYLFFSSGEAVKAYETPTDLSSAWRLWSPRLLDKPDIAQTFANVRQGLVTTPDVGIDLANTDGLIETHLTAEHTFYDKACRIWLCVNSIENIQLLFVGKVKEVSLSEGTASFTARSALSDLSIPGTLGQFDEAFLTQDASYVVAIKKEDELKPVKFIFGSSRVKFKQDVGLNYTVELPSTATASGNVPFLDAPSIEEAHNINYTINATTSNNRRYMIGRAKDFRALDFGTVNYGFELAERDDAATVSGYQYIWGSATRHNVCVMNLTGHNLQVGDSFTWSSTGLGGGTRYGIVTTIELDSQSFGAGDGDDVFFMSSDTFAAPGSTTAHTNLATLTLNTNQAPALCYYDTRLTPPQRPLFYTQDYTYTIGTTTDGYKYMYVTLANNVEGRTYMDVSATDSSNLTLDPNVVKIYYRQGSTDTTHGEVVQALLESASDLPVNAASITAADAALTANCGFTIPQYDESSYSDIATYLGYVLQSTLGYVYINSSGEYVYQLVSAPSAGQAVNQTYSLGLTVFVDYQDLVTAVSFANPNYDEVIGVGKATVEVSSAKFEHLYGKRVLTNFRHVLTDISGRSTAIFNALANRRVYYEFVAPQSFLDKLPGDDLTLTSGLILGGLGSDNLKIISIQTNGDDVAVQAEDLEGLS